MERFESTIGFLCGSPRVDNQGVKSLARILGTYETLQDTIPIGLLHLKNGTVYLLYGARIIATPRRWAPGGRRGDCLSELSRGCLVDLADLVSVVSISGCFLVDVSLLGDGTPFL